MQGIEETSEFTKEQQDYLLQQRSESVLHRIKLFFQRVLTKSVSTDKFDLYFRGPLEKGTEVFFDFDCSQPVHDIVINLTNDNEATTIGITDGKINFMIYSAQPEY